MPATLERFIAQIFGGLIRLTDQKPERKTIIIVGANKGARLLAQEIGKTRERVTLIDTDDELCRLASVLPSVGVFRGDPADIEILRRAGAENAICVFAATTNDQLNLAVCQAAEMEFDSPRLIAVVNEKHNEVEFELMGYEVMSLARAALTLLNHPPLTKDLRYLLEECDGTEQLVDVSIVSPASIGRRLNSIPLDSCEVLTLGREGVSIPIAGESTSLRIGDVLTLFGTAAAVEAARERLNPGC